MTDKFKGWPFVMNDMCLANELTDVKPVNLPNFYNTRLESQDWYAFAGFFPPGYHQCLIYDPHIDRAFC